MVMKFAKYRGVLDNARLFHAQTNDPVERRVAILGSKCRIQRRRKHTKYRVVNLQHVCENLRLDGWEVEVHPSRSGWRAIVRTWLPVAGDSKYKYGATILLTNDGERAVRILPTLSRVVCENVFTGSLDVVKIHHCNEKEIARFEYKPADYVYTACLFSTTLRDTLDFYKRVGLVAADHEGILRLRCALREQGKTRTHKHFVSGCQSYAPLTNGWDVIQALTERHNQGLTNLANRMLDETCSVRRTHDDDYAIQYTRGMIRNIMFEACCSRLVKSPPILPLV